MGQPADRSNVVTIERAGARGPAVIVCEHAANTIPEGYGDLGLSAEQRAAHIAWDPGALGLARGLAQRLGAPLVYAGQSRLIYDLNRPPNSPGAMAEQSEIHQIPGNRNLPAAERARRTRVVYLPFHDRLRRLIALRLAAGKPTALLTVHSFTPIYHGRQRLTEIGVIHDRDDRLARVLVPVIAAATGRDVRLNEPYSAADGVAHTLALHATPLALPHAMLEIRNDLIADPPAQAAMAAGLAPCIRVALETLEEMTCRAG